MLFIIFSYVHSFSWMLIFNVVTHTDNPVDQEFGFWLV